ncbi:TPA: hypothetical protein NG663_004580 [Vibrio parahaemolyticus]|nr:hypothetical protein [Vibrio parahaemolyticus]
MNKLSKNTQLISFANRMTKKVDRIDVLQDKFKGQYAPYVTFIDDHFKQALDKKTLLLPEINHDGNSATAIFSDYGGEAKDSAYLTYSFLVCGWNHSYGLELEMKKIREKYNLGEKEISFKDFRYGPIKRALPEYLTCLNNYVYGLLFTVIIDKKVGKFFNINTEQGASITQVLEAEGLGVWKPKVAEKLLRITHTAAYLAGLLADGNQKIFWMTDSDAIASTDKQLDHLLNLFDRILPLYSKQNYPLVGGAIPFKERSVKMSDLLSSTDIAAGSIEHYFTRRDKMADKLTVKEEANLVLDWLGRDGVGLKKRTMIMTPGEEPNTVSYGEVKFQSESETGEFVPIYL